METFSTLLALCVGNSPVNSPHKGPWRGALMFSLICAWRNSWVNNFEAGDLRHHHAHYDVGVMRSYLIYEHCVFKCSRYLRNILSTCNVTFSNIVIIFVRYMLIKHCSDDVIRGVHTPCFTKHAFNVGQHLGHVCWSHIAPASSNRHGDRGLNMVRIWLQI